MKLLLAVLLTVASFASADPLKPKGDAPVELTLVQEGKRRYRITVPADATSRERKALSDLDYWITQIAGDDLVPARRGALFSIKIDDRLAPEAYRIAVDGQNVVLAGGPGRGVINAVYALLEEDVGCRFYTNDSIKIPAKAPTLKISITPRSGAPGLVLRDPFYFASFDPAWSLRNRTNAPDAKVPEEFGGHVDYGGLFVHTAAALLPPDKYFKDHPEYFIKDAAGKRSPAQWCSTDPDVARIVTENVLAALAKNRNTEIISVSKNDSGGDQLCHCDRCEKLRAAEGTEMANQLVLVNRVAEAIEKTHPSVLVDTLAYLDTIGVPKTIRPRKNVIIRVCNDSVGSWSQPFSKARDLPVAKITQQWSAVHDKLSIWDYNINFSHFLAPMPNMDIIADNIRFWTENHAVGVMTQGGYQSTSEQDEMRSWVIAKLMWDPSRDEKALVEDFLKGHYGKVAPLMIEYDALLTSSRNAHTKELETPPGGIRYPMTIGLFDKAFIDRATEIFSAARLQASNEPVLLARVERAELPLLYVKLSQGPVTATLLDRFERIAKREKVDWLLEWQVRLPQQIETWRKQLPVAAAEPIVISQGKEAYTYHAFPDACRLKNGDILVAFYAGYGHVSLEADDFPGGGRICMVRSSDEGRTWSEPAVLFDDADDNRDAHIAQLDDGTVVCTFFSWQHKGPRFKSYKEFDWKTWSARSNLTGVQMTFSHDNGQTWETKARSVYPSWVSSAPVRQLKDGTCVLGLYHKDPETKLQVGGSARSTDGGKTWQPPITIKSPAGVSLDAETDIIQLNDGRLFAALRSTKENMHFSVSDDGGKTWAEAKDIGFKGHCPHLNRLSTGEIILCHRLPNTSIHISRDDTKTWQGPFEIDSCVGAYPATVELKDGSVLIIYYTEGENSVIKARRFKLTPDEIEFLPLK